MSETAGQPPSAEPDLALIHRLKIMQQAMVLAEALEAKREMMGTFWPDNVYVPEPSMEQTAVNGQVLNDITIRQAYEQVNTHLNALPPAVRCYRVGQGSRPISCVVLAWLGTDPASTGHYLWQTADIPLQLTPTPKAWLPNLQP